MENELSCEVSDKVSSNITTITKQRIMTWPFHLNELIRFNFMRLIINKQSIYVYLDSCPAMVCLSSYRYLRTEINLET